MNQEEELLEQVDVLSREGERRGRWSAVKVRPRAPRGVAKGWEAGAVVTLVNYQFPKELFIKKNELLWEPRFSTELYIVTPTGYPFTPPSNFYTKDVLWVRKGSKPYVFPSAAGTMDDESAAYWDVPVGCQFWRLRLQAFRPLHDTLVIYEKVIQRRLQCGYGRFSAWESDSDSF